MKIFLLLAFSFLLSAYSKAQSVVFDPQHLAAVIANGAVRGGAEATHNHLLGNINNNLNDICNDAEFIVIAQSIIYNALANVNSALKDGMAVKNLSIQVADMIGYLNQCLNIAQSDPYLLLFASNIESEMIGKSITLLSDVSGYILKEGDNVLADYNSRDQLLRKVTKELQVLDGLAYGAWRAMYWAKERGIVASTNPFAGFINKDKQSGLQIIQNTKYLRR